MMIIRLDTIIQLFMRVLENSKKASCRKALQNVGAEGKVK
jgi:hypothetical protein